MPVAFIVTIAVVLAGRLVRHATGLPRALVAGAILGTALLLWVVAGRAHARAVRLVARDLSRPAGAPRGVPRWVEELRNAAFGFGLAGIISVLEELVPE